MKRILYTLVWVLGLQVFLSGCDLFQEEDFALGAPPTAADAAFTYEPSAENDNIINFTSPSTGAFIKNWDFGNGSKAQGSSVTGVFPLKGTYEVTLTVFTSGGSVSSTQTIEIAETDPTLLDLPVYNMLTGGNDRPEGKTWVIDAARAGHFGLGPDTDVAPIWYTAGANEKAGGGLYNDKYTFVLADFEFNMETAGDVYLNGAQQGEFPGATASPVGDFMAPYTAPDNLQWSVTEDAEGNQFITISEGGFIGYYTGVRTYQIISLTENEMMIRSLDTGNEGFAWYHRLIPEGFTPPPPPPPATTTLPVDFEGATAPPFNGFGGTTYEVVDNPDASGINTSARVGKYVKGTEGNWAGIETALHAPLDFSTNTLIKYKVYSPVAGRALFKLERLDGSADPVEVFADVTKVNEWEELTFDFSAVPGGTYDKIAMFLDFDNNNGGTFYIDDIRQAAETAELTLEALTGGSAKSWKLKPAAGSFGVGQTKGSDNYWPNGQDISGDRPCLFNDEYIFKTGGVYEYDANGDVFGEPYMGVDPAACVEESTLSANAQVWGSGTHSFSFTPATATEPAYITVTGTGAFIALPKAYNGGEHAAPPTTESSVTYEVLSYVKNGNTETLSITVDISGDGSTFWSFVLISE
ncbi:PKD domain-containing protein [Cesiribacter sp. SM1]|uniref:PKD domain-containing protein n=1 Tax=Cesiribacter sp. SM1 TaxID=2861196 RepID=UPI001CD48432|nr:PKD domain-containing protein [Cesiribacter sp. SM1]